MVLEIERRFLCREFPLSSVRRSLWQGYLLASETASVRIRSVDEREWWLTAKDLPDPADLTVRREVDLQLGHEQFQTLESQIIADPIVKARYELPIDGIDGAVSLVVDKFGGHLDGLVIAEVEFESVSSGTRFDPLEWMGVEISGDHRYLNSVLARSGIPG